MNEKQEAKLDRLLEGMAAMAPQVKDNKFRIKDNEAKISELKEDTARLDERVKDNAGDIDALGSKVRTHVADKKSHSRDSSGGWFEKHFKFLMAISAVLTGAVLGIAQFQGWFP